MSGFPQVIISVNALFFLLYGLQCYLSLFMIREFRRLGLSDFQRVATGTLQLLGASGLFIGFFIPMIGLMASIGLAIMMLVALLVRMKVGDTAFQSAPAFLFLALNGWIAVVFYACL